MICVRVFIWLRTLSMFFLNVSLVNKSIVGWIGYIHTYIPTYLHTYIPTYIHTYIPLYLRTYLPTYLRTYVLTYLRTYVYILYTYLRTYVLTYLRTCVPTYLGTYVLTYLRTYVHRLLHRYVRAVKWLCLADASCQLQMLLVLSGLQAIRQVFDNRDYDLRSPSEWLALAKDPETGEERPVGKNGARRRHRLRWYDEESTICFLTFLYWNPLYTYLSCICLMKFMKFMR